jgi:hypothetical protein
MNHQGTTTLAPAAAAESLRAVSGRPGDVLLERDRQLERIGECLGRARQGHGGALVVEGATGIGKTALLVAARDAAQADGFRVLRARGAELEREFAFGVVRQLIDPVVAGASEQARARLLDGPPGVAARLLGLPGLDSGAAERPRTRLGADEDGRPRRTRRPLPGPRDPGMARGKRPTGGNGHRRVFLPPAAARR